MAARSKKVVESTQVETPVSETAVMTTEDVVKGLNEMADEVAKMEPETQTIDFSMIKDTIDNWSNNAIEDLIAYSQSVIINRKRNEKAEIEKQILELQMKLRGIDGETAISNGEKAVKNKRPIINPKDPSQVYTMGKHPKWLQDLVAEQTAKNLTKPTWIIMNELREASKTQ